MDFLVHFLITGFLLGIGLAMDAFSVSLANGLNEPCMKRPKMTGVAAMFGFFQGLMPLIGWLGVHTVLQYFSVFEKLIPWIALTLLGWIGGNMISDGIKNKDDDTCRAVGFKALLIQGIATSIDALSVGFTISEYNFLQALATAVLIAGVTFVICYLGILIGKKAGTKLAGKAGILGGAILIFIGLEIFITSLF